MNLGDASDLIPEGPTRTDGTRWRSSRPLLHHLGLSLLRTTLQRSKGHPDFDPGIQGFFAWLCQTILEEREKKKKELQNTKVESLK